MTAPEHVSALLAAARRRHDDTWRRATEAMRLLDSSGEPVSFAAVAQSAGVSRAWLYRQPDLRAEIDKLRRPRNHTDRVAPPVRERATQESLRRQLDALRALAAELRADNQRLQEALARKLGQRRTDATG
ncbi:MAG: DUF6262 family protein [Mycobacteriales bacterium]